MTRDSRYCRVSELVTLVTKMRIAIRFIYTVSFLFPRSRFPRGASAEARRYRRAQIGIAPSARAYELHAPVLKIADR